MLWIFLAWVYYTLMFCAWGAGIRRILLKLSGLTSNTTALPVFLIPWLGICGIALLLSILSVFMRINWESHVIILALSVLFFITENKFLIDFFKELYFRVIKSYLFLGLLFLAAFFIAFACADIPAYNLDPGRYQFQSILWAHTYPVVPGLANLHDRFGHNSSWFLLHAMGEVFLFSGKTFHVFNGLIFLYWITFGVWHITKIKNNTSSVLSWYVLFSTLFCIYYFNYISYWYLPYPTADLPVNLFVLVFFYFLMWAFSQLGSDNAALKQYYIYLFVLISFSAFSFKTSGIYLVVLIPFLVIRFGYQMISSHRLAFFSRSVIACLILCMPTLVRNYYLSGWLLFPHTIINFPVTDWQLPAQMIDGMIRGIRLTAFTYGIEDTNFNAISKIYSTPYYILFYNWLQRQLMYFGFIYWLVAALTVFTVWRFIKQGAAAITWEYRFLLIMVSLLLSGWLFASPEFRYGWGFMCLFFSIFASVSVANFPRQPLITKSVFGIIAGWMIVLFIKIIIASTPVSARQNGIKYPGLFFNYLRENIQWTELSSVPVSKFKKVKLKNGQEMNISQYDTSYIKLTVEGKTLICKHFDINTTDSSGFLLSPFDSSGYNAFVSTMTWMTPLPTAGALYPGLEMRGDKLEKGFRIAQ